MDEMIERVNLTEVEIPVMVADCGHLTRSQTYTVTLRRAKVTREWLFCSLECARAHFEPMK